MKRVKGKCYLCNDEFSKKDMLDHVCSCKTSYEGFNNKSKKKQNNYMLLFVEDEDNKNYWMYLFVKSTCKLKDLDLFLRAAWLECCGHLSSFKIEYNNYENNNEYTEDFGRPIYDMDIKLNRILEAGMGFNYEYDFGSPTSLKFNVFADDVMLKASDNVILLARNNKHEVVCEICQKNLADYIYMDYIGDTGFPYICEECTSKSNCDNELLMLHVNSPRTGVCGYQEDTETTDDILMNLKDLKQYAKNLYSSNNEKKQDNGEE